MDKIETVGQLIDELKKFDASKSVRITGDSYFGRIYFGVYETNKGRVFISTFDCDSYDESEMSLEDAAEAAEYEEEKLQEEIASGKVKIIDGKRYELSEDD